jgi:hypothetical protein
VIHAQRQAATGIGTGGAKFGLKSLSDRLLRWVPRTAKQLNLTTVWNLCCDHLKQTIARIGLSQTHRFIVHHANGIL